MKHEAQIVEALVHESAHHYFRIRDGAHPLVESGHAATYASPLRRDPRPLRGIFLAYHALAYICACFTDSSRLGLGLADERELSQLRAKARDAECTLAGAAAHLTESGREFFEQTRAVVDYGW
jgi:HEXXH motif-containing protein